jgi:mannose-6-phosphate isomerase-like protein (cupin superfamily)
MVGHENESGMGYHLVDPHDLEQWDDRPTDVRSLSAAAGYDYQDSKLGVRVYELAPGEQSGLAYHLHDEQVELFFVLAGTLHVETPEQEYVVETEQALFVDPGSPQRAFNPDDAEAPVRVLAVGAPSVDDAHPYDPDSDE